MPSSPTPPWKSPVAFVPDVAPLLKLAVFGDPIEHSLSPRIHAGFGRQLKIEVDYQKIRSSVAQLPERIARFRTDGGQGANLTVPLKQAGRRLCTRLDQAARQARAVNTLVAINGGWHGHNTDGPGLMLDLARLGIELRDQRILIVGAGGATAGILGPLLLNKPERICILNRTATRAIELAERFEHLGMIEAAGLDQGPETGAFSVMIQATSLGHQNSLPRIHLDWLTSDAVIYDLNYGAAHHPLALWSSRHKVACHDGLGMLVGQAALAFQAWTGHLPEISPALDDLKKAINSQP